jgi:hypothetical protein
VGRLCDLGSPTPGPNEVIVASPSLDCVTRACLKVPFGNPDPPKDTMYPTGPSGLCTAECTTDADCERVPESPCQSGFACGVAITAPSPYCCKKVCICRDYILVPPTGQLAPKPECDPTNADNACCNLAGRAGNPMYPLCGP